MKIKLNGNDIEQDTGGLTTLGSVLEELVKNSFGKTEFITAMSINGEALPEDKFDTFQDKPIEEIESLELASDTPREISLRALGNLGEFLDTLVESLETSADKFRVEEESEANKHFISCVEGLQTFVGIIDKVKSLNTLDLAAITLNAVPVAEKEDALIKTFSKLHEVQQNKDWVNMADLLEYEMSPLIKDWKEIIPIMADAIRQKEA